MLKQLFSNIKAHTKIYCFDVILLGSCFFFLFFFIILISKADKEKYTI